jgi:hypothetical protein
MLTSARRGAIARVAAKITNIVARTLTVLCCLSD